MSSLIRTLDQNFSDKCYIDVEVNSLEDAYINIAKEEERLLENIKKHGVYRQSLKEERLDGSITEPLFNGLSSINDKEDGSSAQIDEEA